MQLDAALAAIAEPTRRAICQRLAQGPATAGQLADLFPISRPAVSQHLRVLLEAGLVRRTGTHRQTPYELAPAPLLEIEAWSRRLVAAWQAAPLPRTPSPRQTRPIPKRGHP